MLDAKAQLPVGATFTPAVKQRIAIGSAVRLDIRRDAFFPASALRGGEADRRAGRVEAERMRPYRVLSCPKTEVGPPQMSPPDALLFCAAKFRRLQSTTRSPSTSGTYGSSFPKPWLSPFPAPWMHVSG